VVHALDSSRVPHLLNAKWNSRAGSISVTSLLRQCQREKKRSKGDRVCLTQKSSPLCMHFRMACLNYLLLLMFIQTCSRMTTGILTRIRAGWPRNHGSISGRSKRSCLHYVQTGLGPMQPPIQTVLGALSPGMKCLGYEVDHTLPPGAEVKNAWTHTSTETWVVSLAGRDHLGVLLVEGWTC
jgi:hypothetical protein